VYLGILPGGPCSSPQLIRVEMGVGGMGHGKWTAAGRVIPVRVVRSSMIIQLLRFRRLREVMMREMHEMYVNHPTESLDFFSATRLNYLTTQSKKTAKYGISGSQTTSRLIS